MPVIATHPIVIDIVAGSFLGAGMIAGAIWLIREAFRERADSRRLQPEGRSEA